MTKPVLPPCSVAGCTRAAGAIINDALLCGEHAVVELERVLKMRGANSPRSDTANKPPDQ
jgi:hypothetical protein